MIVLVGIHNLELVNPWGAACWPDLLDPEVAEIGHLNILRIPGLDLLHRIHLIIENSLVVVYQLYSLRPETWGGKIDLRRWQIHQRLLCHIYIELVLEIGHVKVLACACACVLKVSELVSFSFRGCGAFDANYRYFFLYKILLVFILFKSKLNQGFMMGKTHISDFL